MTPGYSGPLERGGRRLADRALAVLGVQRTERVRVRTPAVAAGSCAGLAGGLVVGGLLAAQGLLAGGGLVAHVALATGAGALFGAAFGHRANGHGAIVGSGLVVGLLWWVVRSLTIGPLVTGTGAAWSLAAAGAAVPDLVGALLLGGALGVGVPVLAPVLVRAFPALAEERAAAPADPVRVVVVGGGFGGITTAQTLDRVLPRGRPVDITVVSASNYLLFTPMLAEVASSALEPQHISVPLRAFAPGVTFRHARVDAVDTAAQLVRLAAGPATPPEDLPYDHLVMAVGGIPNYRDLPGVEEHALTLKTLEDATGLRNHVISQLERAGVEPDPAERARQLTFVVAGGGFAGAELIAELFDLVHGVRRYYRGIQRDRLRFVLVHSQDRILPELSEGLADYALRKLRDKGIEFRLGRRVAGMTPAEVRLDDGTVLPTRTMVWTAGNQPNPLVKTLGFETRSGALACAANLRVLGASNVWALGDCASVPDALNRGTYHPPTAQHALRQAKTLARNIAAVLEGATPRPFRFRAIGMLVVLGHQQAAAEIRGLKFSGLVAWLMWRGIYLTKLPGLEKRIRVLLDWALELFFPRDIVLTQVPPAAARPGPADGHGAVDAAPAPVPDDARHLAWDDRTFERIPLRRARAHAPRGDAAAPDPLLDARPPFQARR